MSFGRRRQDRLSHVAALQAVLALALLAASRASAGPAPAEDPLKSAPLPPVIGRLVTATGEARLPDSVVAAILGTAPGGEAVDSLWAAAVAESKADRPDQASWIVLVFAEPVGSASLLSDCNVAWSPAGQAAPTDPLDQAWQAVIPPANQAQPKLLPLPAGSRIASLRLGMPPISRGPPARPTARLLAARLYNATPTAWINAESEYTRYPSMGPPVSFPARNLLTGSREWRNTGPDKDERIPRPPVSDVHPSWVVVSWDEAVRCRGLIARGNVRNLMLYTYTGPPGVNPCLAPDTEWRRLPVTAGSTVSTRKNTEQVMISFPEIETRALRLLITRTTEGPVARLDGLTVVATLEGETIPAPAERVVSGLPVPYATESDGLVTLAITDAAGRTIRNLMARRQRTAGEHQELWDLKDAGGSLMQPGTYRFKGISHPPLVIRYLATPYPNVGNHSADNTPWETGHAGSGGWLADHSDDGAVATAGENAYLGSACAEDGIALIETDLDGRKQWGRHNFIAWTGPQRLAANRDAVYAHAWSTQSKEFPGGADFVWRVDRETHDTSPLLTLPPTPERARGVRGMTALDDRLLLAVAGQKNWLVNAVAESDVDINQCVPRPRPRGEKDRYDPDPRRDFMRMFRITGTPPGQSTALASLVSERGPERRQHILLALQRPLPLGTLVFPMPPPGETSIRFSTLKPGVALPPDLNDERLWETIPLDPKERGWAVLPLPPKTRTQALRISFTRGDDDDVADLLDEVGESGSSGAWNGALEGMKILQRRFRSLLPEATLRFNSGSVNAAGEWDAQRDRPLTADDPAIYALEWARPQPVRGLAIREIDAKRVEIDVFTGPENAAVELADDTLWKPVAEFVPPRRYYYSPDENHNSEAHYLDGYVDFGPDVTTRAVRLRMVEQWSSRADGRQGLYGVRRDRGGLDLVPSRCHVYGVAPLQSISDDKDDEEDPLGSQRLEVYDLRSGRLDRELPLSEGGDLAAGPDGQVYALSGTRVVRLDLEGGDHTVMVEGLESPRALAVDAAGRMFVFEAAPDLQVVRVYDPAGQLLRHLGTPGGFQVGAWDPTRFGNVTAMAIDSRGQLWVAERQHEPKRTTIWNADGTFRRELFGRTRYGGGGVVDPGNPNLLYYGPLEFELNPETGRTRLRSLTWLGSGQAGEQPISIEGRKYLVTRQSFFRQTVGIVYLYEEGVLRQAAAIGLADRFPPLAGPACRPLFGRKPLSDFQFTWSDLNGNGAVDPDEVRLLPRRIKAVTNFDPFLGVTGDGVAFEVARFLPDGVPIYEMRELPFAGSDVTRLLGGGFFEMGVARGRDPSGRMIWHYPTEGTGVHAYYKAGPLQPEQVVAEFSIIGQGRARGGDLGEYLVTSSNTGAWHLWTADGLLADYIFLDLRDPRARRWNMPDRRQGMVVENVTSGQEHFWGSVTQADDGRTFGVYRSCNVFEIEGLDRFRRFEGTITVTEDDVRRALSLANASAAESAYREPRLLDCPLAGSTLVIDGSGSDWEAIPAVAQDLPAPYSASLKVARDAVNLYLLYQIGNFGRFENSGEDMRQLFKTGACVDIMLGIDPQARGDRTVPVAGDQRLLFAMQGGRPTAVLYEAVVPGLDGQAGERFATEVFTTSFDRIRRLENARIAVQSQDDGYTLEAAIPFRELGLAPIDGGLIKFDWGVLRGDTEGHSVMGRHYWSNQSTGIVSDVAAEAMLEPRLWGHLRFAGRGNERGKPPKPTLDAGGALPDTSLDALLKEFDEELR
jgi:hypothetical protein